MKILFLCFLIVFAVPSVNADENFVDDTVKAITETVQPQTLDTGVENFSFSETMNTYLNCSMPDIEGIAVSFGNTFFKEIKENVSLALKLIVIAVCCSVIQIFTKGTTLPDISFYVCYMVIFIFCINSLNFVSTVCKNAIDSFLFFMESAIPVLGSALAGSGKTFSVTTLCLSISVICGACNILSQILIPFGKMCAVVGGISGLGINLTGISAAFKRAVLWALGIITTILTSFVSLQSFASSATDNIAIKTAKFTAGSIIPVIGGTVSDTLESIFACGALVKNAAGATTVVALVYICMSPILKILSVILAYRFVSAIISPFSDLRIVSTINGFAESLYIFLALVIASCIMLIICAGLVCRI